MTDTPPQRPQFDPADLTSIKPERVSLRLLIFLAIAFVVINSIITTVGVVLIRSTQTQNKPTVDNTNYLVGFIKDCTTAGGKCFENNLQKTAKELAAGDHQNRQVSAATAACAVRLGSELATMNQHQAYRTIYACQQAELLRK